jgi:hypothetical protein
MNAADELISEGHPGLFWSGDQSTARAMYEQHDLEAVVRSDADPVARVLAAEVLRAFGERPDADLGPAYAQALGKLNLGNLWGMLGASSDDGPLGSHLIEEGASAAPELRKLLDDDTPLFYEGSKEATAGNAQGYTVGDAAAYFLRRIDG